MTDVLERTKEPTTDQSRAQVYPKVPFVSKTIPNNEVKVYGKEEYDNISKEEKNSELMPLTNASRKHGSARYKYKRGAMM